MAPQSLSKDLSKIKTGELKIPTSYGHISAKSWGENKSNCVKVLAVHGWQDNAGTFDRLFPLLPLSSMYIVAIDLPGHGSSSHLPKGIPYTDMTWIVEIRRTLIYLQWQSDVTIIAHSMGANACLELATLYPEIVSNLVMLDTIKPPFFEQNDLAKKMAESITNYTNLTTAFERPRPQLVFDLDKACDVIIQTHLNGTLNKEAALCLLPRAVEFRHIDNKSGFVFKRDNRLNVPIYRKFDKKQLLVYLSSIQCRLMILRARNTHHTLRSPYEKDFLNLYKENCSQFYYIEVNGDHYVHLTSPLNVAHHIAEFLQPVIDSLN